MSSANAPEAAASVAVHRQAERAGALLGQVEDTEDDVLANLLLASWPTPAVVDEEYGRYPWTPLGGSLVKQRFAPVDSRRMVSICTTIRGMCGPLYAVPEGTVTDFPFFRTLEDWRICQVLQHFAVRELLPEVGENPHFSWEYYPGTAPKLGEEDSGVFVPGAMGEWNIRTSFCLVTLCEQHEVRDVPVVRRKALCPTTPVWL